MDFYLLCSKQVELRRNTPPNEDPQKSASGTNFILYIAIMKSEGFSSFRVNFIMKDVFCSNNKWTLTKMQFIVHILNPSLNSVLLSLRPIGEKESLKIFVSDGRFHYFVIFYKSNENKVKILFEFGYMIIL